MFRVLRVLIFSISLVLMMTSLASAHSGGTDKYGGHRDIKTGGYHYHNAGTAHDPNNPYQDHTKCGICNAAGRSESQIDVAGAPDTAKSNESKNQDTTLSSLLWFVLGALASLFITYLFYKKSKLSKEPMYDVRSFNLIGDFASKYEKLKVTYADNRISNLTISKFLFWNAGKDTIRNEDIAAAEPLCVVCKERNTIFESNILAINEPANNFRLSISPDNQQVLIQFDYVDHDQGMVFQIIHTGRSSAELDFRGKLKGVPRIRKRTITTTNKATIANFLSEGLMIIVLSVLGGLLLSKAVEKFGFEARWTIIPATIFAAFILYWINAILSRRVTAPKGLDLFIN